MKTMEQDFVVLFISQLMSFLISFVSMMFCGHLGKSKPAVVGTAVRDLVIVLFPFLLSSFPQELLLILFHSFDVEFNYFNSDNQSWFDLFFSGQVFNHI